MIVAIVALAFLVFLLGVPLYIRLNKGKISEKLIHLKLNELPEEYHIFNDVYFQSNGRSVQIDHIIISPYGVFIIETKGYKGWIYGGEDLEYWTQNIYGRKYQFYNPILQNFGHVRFLSHLLKVVGTLPIVPIVVFNNDADLKLNLTRSIVVNRSCLLRTIRQYRDVLISDVQQLKIVDIISRSMAVSDNLVSQHQAFVRNRVALSQTKIDNGICPRCSGQIVKRNGRYGVFYGCSNYPRCRFTMSGKKCSKSFIDWLLYPKP